MGHLTSSLNQFLTHRSSIGATEVLIPGNFNIHRFDPSDTLVFVFFELLSKVRVLYIAIHIDDCMLDLGISNNYIQFHAFLSVTTSLTILAYSA